MLGAYADFLETESPNSRVEGLSDVEGISLVANYRDQFREVASRGGPTVVIQKLKEKNAAPTKPASS